MSKYRFLALGLVAGAVMLLSNCNTKFYHNVTTRYNPYFLAKNRLDSLELAMFRARKENYNRVLEVLPLGDTASWKAYDARMEDCIKKIYIIHNRHQESDLIYKAYSLLGNAHFYRRKFDLAVQTYKFVNSKSNDEAARDRALVGLMQLYTQIEDYRAANEVLSLLKKRHAAMSKENRLAYYMVRGHFHRQQNEFLETAKSLGSALEVLPRGERRGRVYFMLGQLYQKLGKDRLAYKDYRQVRRNNPTYEMVFFANLYAAQIQSANSKNPKRVLKFYSKLLKDVKNKEYQDKIHYEIALYHLSQDKLGEAIQQLRQSVKVSQNPAQKGYSFLKLAEIAYTRQQDYELAKQYYDSTLATLPQTAEEFAGIVRRKNVLDEFVKHLKVYRLQDSLLRLVQMPPANREKYLQERLLIEETAKQNELDSLAKVEEERLKLQQNSPAAAAGGTLAEATANQNPGAGWYFDNPARIQQGAASFRKRWGNRPLGDYWRLGGRLVPDTAYTQKTNTKIEIDPETFRREQIQKRVESRRKAIIDSLPKSPDEVLLAKTKIENALYQLGKIYRFKLEEPANAVAKFDALRQRFPQTKYDAEALYLLHLTHRDLKQAQAADTTKQALLTRHPNSNYARLLVDPDYLTEARATDAKAKLLYKRAYELYDLANYEESMATIGQLETTYPKNLIEDKVVMLKALVQYRIDGDKKGLLDKLTSFIIQYPDSPLKPQAMKWEKLFLNK